MANGFSGRLATVGADGYFCDDLLAKYGDPDNGRPNGFCPRLGAIAVYAITAERMTGKQTPLPAAENRWPLSDGTATPNARVPGATHA